MAVILHGLSLCGDASRGGVADSILHLPDFRLCGSNGSDLCMHAQWQQCIDLTAMHDNPLSPALKTMLKVISAVGMCGTKCKKFIVDGSFIAAMCSEFLEEYPVFDAERFDPTVSVKTDEGRSIMWLRAVAIILLGLEIGARAGESARMTVCCWQAREDGSVYVLVHLAKNGKNGKL